MIGFTKAFRVVMTVGLLLGAACSGKDSLELGLATERSALRPGTLGTCTTSSQCNTFPGMECCAGFCAKASGRLAFLDNANQFKYSCYSPEPSARVPSPLASLLPDFSFAGYEQGGVAIPVAPVAMQIGPTGGGVDDSPNIQWWLDWVAGHPVAPNTPSALLLMPGVYYLNTPIEIRHNNVVLRGAGQGQGGTLLISRISEGHSLVRVGPTSGPNYPVEVSGTARKISGSVPVGATRIVVEGSGFAAGDKVVVVRTPNRAWVEDIHMVNFPNPATDPDWDPAKFHLPHPRKVTAVTNLSGGNQALTIDIPIVDAIDAVYGGDAEGRAGHVAKIANAQFVEHSGVEDLAIDGQFEDTDATTNDGHWIGIRLTGTMNSWVRRVTVRKFGMSAVTLSNWASFNTIEEVAHLDPKSPLHPPAEGGLPVSSHRYSFWIQEGIGNLFQRCFTRDSRHSFVTGKYVTGPNVWLDSLSVKTNAEEGPHLHWATGLLFDNIHTEASALSQATTPPNGGVRVQNAGAGGTSHGWTGAQVMIWNCQAPLVCDAPPAAMNWVVGGVSFKYPGKGSEAYGIWQLESSEVKPRSLYLEQLKARKGTTAVNAVTTPEQRSGRIWDGLGNWAGVGLLSNAYPDPFCVRGKKNGRTCCAAQCGFCGGEGCGSASNGGNADLCCVGDIVENDRSCAHFPAPCVMPSPNCEEGVLVGNSCCHGSCNQCGGSNCGGAPNNPPGSTNNCCTGNIDSSGRSCLEYPPPCVMADPNCVKGLQGNTTCCHASCTQCGGTGCSSSPNIGANCCGGTISASGRTCDAYVAPCSGATPIEEL